MRAGGVLIIGIAVLALGGCAANVDVRYGERSFEVAGETYTLGVNLAKPAVDRLFVGEDGPNLLKGGLVLVLSTDAGEYRSDRAPTAAQVHTLRFGPYLTHVRVENIVLADQSGNTWPGLGQLDLLCHRDRIYVTATCIPNDGETVRDDLGVYQASAGHAACPQTEVEWAGVEIAFNPSLLKRLRPLKPSGYLAASGLSQQSPNLTLVFPSLTAAPLDPQQPARGVSLRDASAPQVWQPGSWHALSFVMVPGPQAATQPNEAAAETTEPPPWAEYDREVHPLPARAFQVSRGRFAGYDPAWGVYRFVAEDAATPRPPRNLYGGCTFTVRNDGLPRTILIDQLNGWGGLRGAVIRDGDGNPLPIVPQMALNFPELPGEPDWAFVTYPLALKPHETRTIQADHLYLGYGRHDQIGLFSLENVGGPALIQTSVGVVESHTMTTGPPEMAFNDFRAYKGSYGGTRSISAVLPTFFRYRDARGVWHKVIPKMTSFMATGPNVVEYLVAGTTDDEKVGVIATVVQAAHSDMTRVFAAVEVQFNQDVTLAPGSPSSLMLYRMHTFNPMVYLKYAYTGADGKTQIGDLDLSGTVKQDGTPLGPMPLVAMYHAPNGLDDGIPCSDLVGNPAFVLCQWKAEVAGRAIKPGLYVFTAKDTGSGGDYSRDVAIVPTQALTHIPKGTEINYAIRQLVYGDLKSSVEAPEAEREILRHWPLDEGIQPTVRGNAAEFTAARAWKETPVTVELPGRGALRLWEKRGREWIPVEQGVHGNDWYQALSDDDGRTQYVLLVDGRGIPGHTYRVTRAP